MLVQRKQGNTVIVTPFEHVYDSYIKVFHYNTPIKTNVKETSGRNCIVKFTVNKNTPLFNKGSQ